MEQMAGHSQELVGVRLIYMYESYPQYNRIKQNPWKVYPLSIFYQDRKCCEMDRNPTWLTFRCSVDMFQRTTPFEEDPLGVSISLFFLIHFLSEENQSIEKEYTCTRPTPIQLKGPNIVCSRSRLGPSLDMCCGLDAGVLVTFRKFSISPYTWNLHDVLFCLGNSHVGRARFRCIDTIIGIRWPFLTVMCYLTE